MGSGRKRARARALVLAPRGRLAVAVAVVVIVVVIVAARAPRSRERYSRRKLSPYGACLARGEVHSRESLRECPPACPSSALECVHPSALMAMVPRASDRARKDVS